MFSKRNRDIFYCIAVIIICLLATAWDAAAQSSTELSRKCTGASPSPSRALVNIQKDGNIVLTPCSGKTVTTTSSGVLLGPNGTSGVPTYSFTADSDTGIFRSSTDSIGFSSAGIERFTIGPTYFRPNSSNAYDLGSGVAFFRDLYMARQQIATQGTITASTPAFTHTATWNSGGVTFTDQFINVTDSASAAASLFIDFQQNSISRLAVRKDGILVQNGVPLSSAIVDMPRIALTSDFTNATAALANVSGLTSALVASGTYGFEVKLIVSDSQAAEGVQCDLGGGTATFTDLVAGSNSVLVASVVTSATTTFANGTLTGTQLVVIEGTVTVNAAGTWIPRCAQASHATGTLTVRRGSSFVLTRIS